MDISIYEWDNAKNYKYHVAGYAYLTDNWHSDVAATVISNDPNSAPLKVRFGWTGTRHVVQVGEITTEWKYPVISVSNVSMGYSTIASTAFDGAWDCAVVADHYTTRQTVTPINQNPLPTSTRVVYNETELRAALSDSTIKVIHLGEDCTLSATTITTAGTKKVILDQGYSITGTGTGLNLAGTAYIEMLCPYYAGGNSGGTHFITGGSSATISFGIINSNGLIIDGNGNARYESVRDNTATPPYYYVPGEIVADSYMLPSHWNNTNRASTTYTVDFGKDGTPGANSALFRSNGISNTTAFTLRRDAYIESFSFNCLGVVPATFSVNFRKNGGTWKNFGTITGTSKNTYYERSFGIDFKQGERIEISISDPTGMTDPTVTVYIRER